jgi:hypothetical protein
MIEWKYKWYLYYLYIPNTQKKKISEKYFPEKKIFLKKISTKNTYYTETNITYGNFFLY